MACNKIFLENLLGVSTK